MFTTSVLWARSNVKVATTVFGAINNLLLGGGLDIGAQAALLHQAAWPAVNDGWGIRNDALKGALHLYAHLQLRLGHLQVAVPRLLAACRIAPTSPRRCCFWQESRVQVSLRSLDHLQADNVHALASLVLRDVAQLHELG